MATNDYLEKLKQQVNSYQEEEKKSTQKGGNSRENILAKYFVPRNDQEIFRILPPDDPNSLKTMHEAFFHEVETNLPNGKKKYGTKIYCPAHNDPMVEKRDENGDIVREADGKPVLVPKPCPLCQKAKDILKKQDNSLKGKKKENLTEDEKVIWDNNKEIFKEAKRWEAKKFYIVKGIDKGKPKDGVKFWRFKKNFRNQGTFDKIMPVINQFMQEYEKPYFDPENGCDLSITMTDATLPNGRQYRTISSIIPKQPSKLHEDPAVVEAWLNDKTTWRDVFKPKSAPNITPHEYLKMLVEGNDPYWDDTDSNNKKWVFPGRPDLEEKANTRNQDLGANVQNGQFEQASDIADDGVTINNVTKSDVGSFNNNDVPKANDVTSGLESEDESGQESENTSNNNEEEDNNTTNSTENNTSLNESDDESESYDDIDDPDDLPF
jgi:hypothetical protein